MNSEIFRLNLLINICCTELSFSPIQLWCICETSADEKTTVFLFSWITLFWIYRKHDRVGTFSLFSAFSLEMSKWHSCTLTVWSFVYFRRCIVSAFLLFSVVGVLLSQKGFPLPLWIHLRWTVEDYTVYYRLDFLMLNFKIKFSP